jgi:alpha-tubulin suppressor-like RCC1 family protein
MIGPKMSGERVESANCRFLAIAWLAALIVGSLTAGGCTEFPRPRATDGGAESGAKDSAKDDGQGIPDVTPSTCPSGMIRCSGQCVDPMSTDHCGPSCAICTAPSGARATCNGTSCGYACDGDLRACGSACIPTGGCCSDSECPPQGGKTGMCDTSTHQCSYACDADKRPCGNTCIPKSGCCASGDCNGVCQTCVSNTCTSVKSQDDTDSCSGTCDATGACKSKQGQMCQATVGGCVGGTTCAPDGYCCDQACSGSCMACDIAGRLGMCTPVASGNPHGNRTSCGVGICAGACANRSDGQCSYPIASCGSPSCSGTEFVDQGTCSTGACVTPPPKACDNGFACSANSCKTACATDADCLPTHFCSGGRCRLDAVQVASGGAFVNSTCALLGDGTIRCWGSNVNGGLGNGMTSNAQPTPVVVSGVMGAAEVQLNGTTGCARLRSDGTIRCWGGNFSGDLGSGSTAEMSLTPVLVTGIQAASSLGVGATCAILSGSGAIWCWGYGKEGKLGNGLTENSPTPVPVTGITGTRAVATSVAHTCSVLTADGSVYCWGYNGMGQLGGGSGQVIATPVRVAGLSGAVAVAVGNDFSCALLTSGAVSCWGLYPGQEMSSPTPRAVDGLGTTAAIAAGHSHMCALVGGSVFCWGTNSSEQLGVPFSSTDRSTNPIRVPGISNATGVAAGGGHSCALLSNGSISCWGSNSNGQLGVDTAVVGSATPVSVSPW